MKLKAGEKINLFAKFHIKKDIIDFDEKISKTVELCRICLSRNEKKNEKVLKNLFTSQRLVKDGSTSKIMVSEGNSNLMNFISMKNISNPSLSQKFLKSIKQFEVINEEGSYLSNKSKNTNIFPNKDFTI